MQRRTGDLGLFPALLVAVLLPAWTARADDSADAGRETVIRSPEEEKAVSERLKAQAAAEAERLKAQAAEAAEREAVLQKIAAEMDAVRAILDQQAAEEQALRAQAARSQDPKEKADLEARLKELAERRARVAQMVARLQDMAARLGAAPAQPPPRVAPKIAVPATPPLGGASVADASNRFAFDLYGRLRGQGGNLFFSPYSLSSALAMTSAGAHGETARQMAAVLHLPAGAVPIHCGYAALRDDLNAPGKPYELAVTSALWGQKGYGFLPGFLGLLKTHYGAPLAELDFAADADGARRTINAHVEKATREKIKDLIAKGQLAAQTRLVLTNAIYFKGRWTLPFDKKAAREDDFLLAPGSKVRVPMMNRVAEYPYADAGDCLALALPYEGGALAMIVLLPKQADGLAALEKSLSAAKVAECLARMRAQEVQVALPRFTMTTAFLLRETLAAMGMPDAFDSAKADFTGMNGGKEPLWIGQVIHKAFVEVNEEGTEAAAATAVVAEGREAPAPPPVFRADRPFLFLIRDVRSGCILFLGRVADPRG